MVRVLGLALCLIGAVGGLRAGSRLWSLQPVSRPSVPTGALNPIDAFVGAVYQEKKGCVRLRSR